MHFLQNYVKNRIAIPIFLPRKWAVVTVRVIESKKEHAKLEIQPGSLGVVKEGIEMVKLPDWAHVVGPDGKRVLPSKKSSLWVTLQTFDPYHAVSDFNEDEMRK